MAVPGLVPGINPAIRRGTAPEWMAGTNQAMRIQQLHNAEPTTAGCHRYMFPTSSGTS